MCVDFSRDSACPKLQFTSPWDFNWTCEGSAERYWAGAFCEADFAESKGDRSNPWFILLIKQDWFRQEVTKKWTELAERGAVSACLDEETALLETYRGEFTSWSKNSVGSAYKVINWLTDRARWMDTQFLTSADTLVQNVSE